MNADKRGSQSKIETNVLDHKGHEGRTKVRVLLPRFEFSGDSCWSAAYFFA